MEKKKENLTKEEIIEILNNTPSHIVECGDTGISCVGLGGSCREGCKSGNKDAITCTESCMPGCSEGCKEACKDGGK